MSGAGSVSRAGLVGRDDLEPGIKSKPIGVAVAPVVL